MESKSLRLLEGKLVKIEGVKRFYYALSSFRYLPTSNREYTFNLMELTTIDGVKHHHLLYSIRCHSSGNFLDEVLRVEEAFKAIIENLLVKNHVDK